MHLCQELIFIWMVLHHARIALAASLRSENLDTSFRGVIKSHHEPELYNDYVKQSNHYKELDENEKFRPMLPYERRNRHLFTSKTYFGKNQLHELPRKYWANKKDKTISPSRVKAFRHMHPLKYVPHRSPGVELNHQKHTIPKVLFEEHQDEIPDQNIDYNYDEYGSNPRYVSESDYDTNPEYGPNPGYPTKDEYGPNPGYPTKDEYGPNPGYPTKDEYGPNPGYPAKDEYGSNPGYPAKDEYGSNPGYPAKDEYGSNPGYPAKDEYGSNPGYPAKDEYGSNPGYPAKDEYGSNPGYPAKDEYGPNPGYPAKNEYGPNPGYPTKDEYDPKRGHATNDEHDQDLEFENEYRYFINHGRDANADKELRENNIDEKGNVNNEDNLFLLSEKDRNLFSLGNDAETSTHTTRNSDFNFDENLKKDELLRNVDEEKFRKVMPADITSNESEDTKELEEFEGSGSIENDFNSLNISDQEANKSARILDIFSRFNDSTECITPKNESGHCLGLTECPLIETMENFISFLQYICRQRGLLGICCPDNPVIEIKETGDKFSEVKLEIQQPPDGCGLSTNTRIVGGTMSLPHEFSWMVALLRRNRFYCGGVIINNWYILTAAHCVLGIKVSDLKVRLGEYDFLQRNDIQQDIPVMEIKRHAHFVTSTFQHDIALLKLKRKIEYTKFIGSICLPNKAEDFSKKNATVAGWGTVSFGGAASPILRQVTVPVWDNKECDRTYVFERINESFMCAGSSVSGEDACQGDSGGPLMSMNDEGRWEVIGIVSWGRRCGDPTYPGVYTRVTSYLDWVAENAQ